MFCVKVFSFIRASPFSFLPCILPVLQQDRMMVFTGVCLTTDDNLHQQEVVKDYSLHVQDKGKLLI